MQETERRDVMSKDSVKKMTPVEQALQRRVNFLDAAQQEGAHLKVPLRELFVVVLLTRGTLIETELAPYYG